MGNNWFDFDIELDDDCENCADCDKGCHECEDESGWEIIEHKECEDCTCEKDKKCCKMRCDCGGDKTNTPHSTWCSKYKYLNGKK